MGYAMVNRPSYDQKLWDDREDWFEAPTFRSATSLVMTLATQPAGGNAGLVFGLASDAAFTMADVSNGVMSVGEGFLSFGKSAVSSVATKFAPGVGDVLNKGFVATMTAGVLDQVVDNAIVGAVNGFNITDGKFGWNGDVLTDSLFGKGAMAGYVC